MSSCEDRNAGRDFPQTPDPGRAPPAGSPGPGLVAEAGGQRDRLLQGEPHELGEGPCRAPTGARAPRMAVGREG
jgi:hypothetical protein